MKVLVTGANGQLGSALIESVPAGLEVIACTRQELDIADAGAVEQAFRMHAPSQVINAAAYTAVDAAENNVEQAHAVNETGADNLAKAAAANNVRMLHVSTDFVFDGSSSRPYRPDDTPAPLGVYGSSKLAGELAVRRQLGDKALILRTAWVYAAEGRNFFNTMLRLMTEKDQLGVVQDQVGAPTAARSLAACCWRLLEVGTAGTYHWTDAGVASWYDFAVAIQEEAIAVGLLDRSIPVHAIATTDYPTPARRPAYSVLDRRETEAVTGLEACHWRVELRDVMQSVLAARKGRG